jgi:hypothetical protein
MAGSAVGALASPAPAAESGWGQGRDGGQQRVRQLAADGGADLGDLLDRSETIEAP